jgi:hypothetical protein
VTKERRQHERYARALEGQWNGASGTGKCRISDISLGGCFIESLAMPAVGEDTTVTIHLGSHRLALAGRIVYVEHGMGFSVQFQDVHTDHIEQLVELLKTLKSDT